MRQKLQEKPPSINTEEKVNGTPEKTKYVYFEADGKCRISADGSSVSVSAGVNVDTRLTWPTINLLFPGIEERWRDFLNGT